MSCCPLLPSFCFHFHTNLNLSLLSVFALSPILIFCFLFFCFHFSFPTYGFSSPLGSWLSLAFLLGWSLPLVVHLMSSSRQVWVALSGLLLSFLSFFYIPGDFIVSQVLVISNYWPSLLWCFPSTLSFSGLSRSFPRGCRVPYPTYRLVPPLEVAGSKVLLAWGPVFINLSPELVHKSHSWPELVGKFYSLIGSGTCP